MAAADSKSKKTPEKKEKKRKAGETKTINSWFRC
jgi:hypothetical protein